MSGGPPPPNDPNRPIAPGASRYVPTRKVGASTIAGAVSVILVWALNGFVLSERTRITPEIAAAITTLMTFAVGYFIPEPE